MSESDPDRDWDADDADQNDSPNHSVVESSDLFRGEKEVCIQHDGVVYRLRITRRNRLILQK